MRPLAADDEPGASREAVVGGQQPGQVGDPRTVPHVAVAVGVGDRVPDGAGQTAARRIDLATGLYRSGKEVWPTTGAEEGILNLCITDKGALAEGAGEYPLLDDGFTNVFKGLILGKTLRGDVVVVMPVIGCNTITGGMPGQGKVT